MKYYCFDFGSFSGEIDHNITTTTLALACKCATLLKAESDWCPVACS